ncbi:MAG: hypothetical protein JNL02_00350 [Saprospiraceae bacterium]|nr:hypothetical protein [Saprospiraceae bacterium]
MENEVAKVRRFYAKVRVITTKRGLGAKPALEGKIFWIVLRRSNKPGASCFLTRERAQGLIDTTRKQKKNEAVPPQHYLSPNQIKPNYSFVETISKIDDTKLVVFVYYIQEQKQEFLKKNFKQGFSALQK